jgi:hypothetical protein
MIYLVSLLCKFLGPFQEIVNFHYIGFYFIFIHIYSLYISLKSQNEIEELNVKIQYIHMRSRSEPRTNK